MKHKKTALNRRASDKLNALATGKATEGMSDAYYIDRNRKCIRRKRPKEHLSKKDRRRRRGTYGRQPTN